MKLIETEINNKAITIQNELKNICEKYRCDIKFFNGDNTDIYISKRGYYIYDYPTLDEIHFDLISIKAKNLNKFMNNENISICDHKLFKIIFNKIKIIFNKIKECDKVINERLRCDDFRIERFLKEIRCDDVVFDKNVKILSLWLGENYYDYYDDIPLHLHICEVVEEYDINDDNYKPCQIKRKNIKKWCIVKNDEGTKYVVAWNVKKNFDNIFLYEKIKMELKR